MCCGEFLLPKIFCFYLKLCFLQKQGWDKLSVIQCPVCKLTGERHFSSLNF